MLPNWQILALTSFLFFGFQNYLYKLIVTKSLDTKNVTFLYILFSSLICIFLSINFSDFSKVSYVTLGLASLDSLAYYITTTTRIDALRYIPSYLVFPIARFSTVLIVIYGVLIFNDPLSEELIISLIIAGVIVLLFAKDRHEHKDLPNYRYGVILAIIAMVSSAATNIVSKYAVLYTDLLAYMTIANLIMSITMFTNFKRQKIKLDLSKNSVSIALYLAAVNLIAWFSYLYAMKTGPLSLVATISGLAFVVPIILSIIFDKEKLNFSRFMIVVLTGVVIWVLNIR